MINLKSKSEFYLVSGPDAEDAIEVDFNGKWARNHRNGIITYA